MTPKYMREILFVLFMLFFLFTVSTAQTETGDSVFVSGNVVVPYGSQPSWMVNSAISSIRGNALLKSFTINTGKALPGRLSGLTVLSNSNEPGADNPTIYIRGINTFGSGKSVLVIIDGIESPYENLVPEEIETISVLKDAAALAMYGSRGANGVLLVTTRKGIQGPMKVNFGVQQGFSRPLRMPEFLNSADFAELYNEALANEGKAPLYTSQDLELYRNGSDPYFHPDVDWYDKILRTTVPVSNYDINFRGGNSSAKYFVLLNLATDKGLYKRTEDLSEFNYDQNYTRFNFRTNIDINVTKTFNASLLLGTQIEKKSNPKDNTTGSMFTLMSQIPPNAFPVYNPDGSFGGSSLYTNPYGDALMNGFYSSNTRTFQIILSATQKLDMIAKGLSISGTGSFNNYFSSWSNKTRGYQRYALSRSVTGDTIYNQFGQNSSLAASESAYRHWHNTEWQVTLHYKRSLGANDLDALLMYSEFSSVEPAVMEPYKNNGLRGRVTVANNKKYIGEVSFSYNGTENFPPRSRWGLFPALSLGWVASEEGFLKNNGIFNYLKFRGSYGLTGNDVIGGTRFMFNPQPYGYGSDYFYGTTNTAVKTLYEGMIRNGEVTWEKEKKLNIGLDAKLCNLFDLNFDYFINDRYDILAKPYQTVPSYLGFGTLPDRNVGKTNNKGFEASIRYNSDQGNQFRYYVSLQMWYAKNKIVYNAEAFQQFEYLYRTGLRIDQPFRLVSEGFFKDQADINNSPVQIFDKVKPGDIKYADMNNDMTVDQNDYYPSGYTGVPELSGGLEAGFSFKGFDFNIFLQGVTNRTVYLSGNYYHAFQNYGKVSSIALGRWTSGTAETATYPRLTASNNLNNYQSSTFWQRDGSFIKLRNVELGYNIPEKLLSKIKFDSIRLFINGTNLFSWDKIDYSDPEAMSGYPAMKTYSIGAKFQL
jgi:TonB-linked SusC/RagA family outer membrane protein